MPNRGVGLLVAALLFLVSCVPQAAPTPAPTAGPTAPVATAPVPAPSPTTSPQAFTWGLILVGPNNDGGWSQGHYEAAVEAAKQTGTNMIYVDNINPSAKPGVTVPQVARDMISRGAKLIITASDDFQDSTLEAAQQFPDTIFVNVSGHYAWKEGREYKAPANYSNFMQRIEYMLMVSGCAAALTTQTGKIGYLGALANNQTRYLVNAVYLGARHCWSQYRKADPKDLKFRVTWIGFWFNIPGQTLDPTKVADEYFNGGYDVVVNGIDTPEALVEADKMVKAGKKASVLMWDYKGACQPAPNVCLGVAYYNWVPAYVKAVQLVMGGTYKQFWDWNWPDFKDVNNPKTSAAGFVKGPAMTPDVSSRIDEFIKAMGDGTVNLWRGPLYLQDGTLYVKDGEVATDLQIWYMPQLLQGMEGPSQ